MTLLLASQSQSRLRLLVQAGVAVETQPAHIDETEIKTALVSRGAAPDEVALRLAELKAERISRRWPDALVIGADQILVCGTKWFDKPRDRAECAAHLRALSGKKHSLETAVCVVRAGTRIWHHHDRPELTMRPLSAAFIEDYLGRLGESALSSVGAYHLEGLGAQLFTRIKGDFFSILGLPLLPLLDFLRREGLLSE